MAYFVCTIGDWGNYDECVRILGECLNNSRYQLHRKARWPAPLDNVRPGDTLLLKFRNHVVAYGVAEEKVCIDSTNSNNPWNRTIKINRWTCYDERSPIDGIHHYGIQAATKSGAGQFAVVKEVEEQWALDVINAFKRGDPQAANMKPENMVICRNHQTLSDVFKLKLYIPDYQRSYCWKEENVLDLLETLRRCYKRDGEIHLGTLILKTQDSKGHTRLAIVDGQQRLLTLTILAFCLQSRVELPLLNESFAGTSNEAQSAQEHLRSAKTTVENWINNTYNVTPDEFIKFLEGQTVFTVVELPLNTSEDLAYTFFNAVNSAGKKLSDYDLLKAHHLRFIRDETTAKTMAERWDANSAEGYDNILHKTLYRLRNWSRAENPAIDAQIDHKLFRHYSAAESSIAGVFYPPLAIRFNSILHGGASFFHYAEQYRMLWTEFTNAEPVVSLYRYLGGHSGNVLPDVIRTLLFAYWCRFGTMYLDEALFCTAEAISILRNESQVRASTINHRIIKDCLYSLEAAIEPGQYFDWCLSPDRQYMPKMDGPTKRRYWEAIQGLYKQIPESAVVKKLIERRVAVLDAELAKK